MSGSDDRLLPRGVQSIAPALRGRLPRPTIRRDPRIAPRLSARVSSRDALVYDDSVFEPYPKTPESVDSWGLNEAQMRRANKLRWVATEKIHGAHLCVRVFDDGIDVAKRKAVLEEDDDFFGYRRSIGAQLGRFRRLYDAVRSERPCAALLVYGEIFGGHYPHPDVREVDHVQEIQSGVYYTPSVEFMAFDIAIATAPGQLEFLPFSGALDHLTGAGIAGVPVCHVGTLDEVLALPVTFPTRVPECFGLPPLADNLAEGLVIRPYEESVHALLENGKATILKRKHPAFAETSYHEAQRWPGRSRAAAERDALGRADDLTTAMLTENRIDSAISKIGPPDSPEARREVEAEVLRDIRDELEERHGAVLLELGLEDRQLLWSVAADAITEAVAERAAAFSLDPDRYLVELALAFIRGRLPDADPTSPERLLAAAREAKLRLHKFKRKDGPPRVMSVLSILEGLMPESLLDIGSGRGAFLWPLLDRFPRLTVTAIDRLPHRIRDIEAVRTGGVNRLEGRLADVEELPFDDDEFDVVTILEVLEHLKDPIAAATEVIRVARDFVIASVPSQPDDNPEHIRLFTADTLAALLEQAGGRRVQVSFVRDHMIAVVRCGA